MLQRDCFMLMGLGGGFIILGIIGIIWGGHEEKDYFDALTARPDLREFMAHWPERPQPGALRIGGWIAIAVGLVLLVTGVILWLLSSPPA
jgi:hypothetical protein